MDWVEVNRDELRSQAERFGAGIGVFGAELNVSTEDIDEFNDELSSYSSELSSVVAAKAAYEAAYESFMARRSSMVDVMRKLNNRMQSAAAITDAKRAEIGIPIPSKPSAVKPVSVTGLTVNAFETGEVKLRWDRGGNAATVIFNVEESDDLIGWNLLLSTTAARANLTGYTPGARKYFRVVATKGNLRATASTPVVIYAGRAVNAGLLAA